MDGKYFFSRFSSGTRYLKIQVLKCLTMGSSCIYFHVLILYPIATCMGVACSMYKEQGNTETVWG